MTAVVSGKSWTPETAQDGGVFGEEGWISFFEICVDTWHLLMALI
jgi:hypothetical protein